MKAKPAVSSLLFLATLLALPACSREFAWLTHIDYAPGAYFRHPVRYGLATEREAEDDPAQAHVLAKAGFEAVTRYDLSLLAGQTTPTARGRIMNLGCSCGIDSIAKL